GASWGSAVGESPTDTGPDDYVLLIERQRVGGIEAKRDEEGERITAHERQTGRYAGGSLKWRVVLAPLQRAAGVATGLPLMRGDALALFVALGLDPAYALPLDQQYIVVRARVGGGLAHRAAPART